MAIRPFTEKVQQYLSQPVWYVYKPGALGSVAASFVASASPDGYTLLGTPQSPVISPPLTQQTDYTLQDLRPICRLSSSPFIVVVQANSRWKTIKDIVEEAKKTPGKLTYSHSGVFSGANVAMEIFLKMAGVQITHVPCTGAAPAITALLGAQVDMTCSSMAPASPHLKSGTLRAIGFFQKQRVKEFPDVPTFAESGYPVHLPNWYGLYAPKNTPSEIVQTIYGAFKKVVEDHTAFLEDRLQKLQLNLYFSGPEETGKDLKEENEVWKKTIIDLQKVSK